MISRQVAAIEELKSLFKSDPASPLTPEKVSTAAIASLNEQIREQMQCISGLCQSHRIIKIPKPDRYMGPQLFNNNAFKEEKMYLHIRNCENGFIASTSNPYTGGAPGKEYVASDEKELAKLVEKLAKEAKDPAKK